jgi:small subunit ribosomal protein S18
MGRNASPSSSNSKRSSTRTPKDAPRRGAKKKICVFCADHTVWVDYKDVNVLRRFVSDRGKIKARRVTGNCVQHQRDVAIAIKTARELALLPYSVRAASDRAGGRGGRGGGGRGRRDEAMSEPREAAVADVELADVGDDGAEAAAGLDVDAVAGNGLAGVAVDAEAGEVEA